MADFAPIFAGWNAWSVYQKRDLDFELSMAGLDRDRRLRIWVENAAAESPGSNVSDPIALKGSQIQIVQTGELPKDLAVAAQREKLSGPLLVLDGPADLRTVRFYNRGEAGKIPWPHDDNYLLEAVFTPNEKSEITSGAPPSHYMDAPLHGAEELGKGLVTIGIVGGLAYLGFQWLKNRKPKGAHAND
ncbi:MAG TPA: hypothetical protein VF420_13420 [Casimicrobiaceae bacterium]